MSNARNLANLLGTNTKVKDVDVDGTELILDSDGDTSITADTDDQIDIKIAGSDIVHVTSTGLGIGQASPSQQLHLTSTASNTFVQFSDSGSGGSAAQARVGCNGNDFIIQNNTASNTAVERMRITSSGNLFVGKTSSGSANVGFEYNNAGQLAVTRSGDTVALLNRTSSDGRILDFRKNNVLVGSVSTNANSLPSDKNFKRDIKDLNIGLNLVSQLQPKSFNLIVDDENSPVMYGLIAQDVEVALEKVGVTKNSAWILQHEEIDDAKESDYSLDYGKLIPILINSIKELEARLTALESK